MKALKDHGKTALEGKIPVIKQPLSIDDQGNDHIYGVRFIPFYERIDLVSEGIRYQIYDPLIDHEEVDGLFVVIKNPDRVSMKDSSSYRNANRRKRYFSCRIPLFSWKIWK